MSLNQYNLKTTKYRYMITAVLPIYSTKNPEIVCTCKYPYFAKSVYKPNLPIDCFNPRKIIWYVGQEIKIRSYGAM